jgi:hypothetical protein
MDYSAQLHYPGKLAKKIQRKRFANQRIKSTKADPEKEAFSGLSMRLLVAQSTRTLLRAVNRLADRTCAILPFF